MCFEKMENSISVLRVGQRHKVRTELYVPQKVIRFVYLEVLCATG